MCGVIDIITQNNRGLLYMCVQKNSEQYDISKSYEENVPWSSKCFQHKSEVLLAIHFSLTAVHYEQIIVLQKFTCNARELEKLRL